MLVHFAWEIIMEINVKTASFNILQNENNCNLIIWTFPCITSELQQLLLSKCFNQFQADAYFCLRRQESWLYIKQFQSAENRKYALCLVASDCNPPKYKLFCDILYRNYVKQSNPVELVRLYLKMYATGCCSFQENGSLISCDLKHFLPHRKTVELIRTFSMETVLIYTGLLLKRRLLVYDNNVETLQEQLLAITALMPHRNINDYLYPLIENVSNELKSIPFFLAGTVQENNSNKSSYFDLFINLPQNEITISPHARDVFAMTKVQKDIATTLIQLGEEDVDERRINEVIKLKTDNILAHLHSLANCTNENNKKILTISELKSKQFNPKLENFLFNLAIAEGMMMI